MDLNTDMEIWDIIDEAPVVKPDDKNLNDPNDASSYVAAIRAMPIYLQLRWVRCMQTLDVIAAMIAAGKRAGIDYDTGWKPE